MKFAIIKTGGKQYKITEGQKIKVEKLNAQAGEISPKQSKLATGQVAFDKVLLIADTRGSEDQRAIRESLADQRGGSAYDIKIGTPYIEGAEVEGKILRQGRDEKKIVFRYHSKTRYRKKKGHRQSYTEIKITDIK